MTTAISTSIGPSRVVGGAIIAAALIAGVSYLGAEAVPAAPPISPVWKASGVVLLAIYAALHRRFALSAALAVSAVGDVMLALEPAQILAGIGSFAVAHVIYAGVFSARIAQAGWRRAGLVIAALLVAFALVMQWRLAPDLGDLRWPVWIYTGLIVVMASLAALARVPTIALIGALLFVTSDAILSIRMFSNGLDWAGPIVWATYFGGQALLTLGLVRPSPAPVSA